MMQRLLPTLLILGLFTHSCAPEPEATAPAAAPTTTLTHAELNALVADHLTTTDEVFDWNEASDRVVWSALEMSEYHAALGYRPAGQTAVESRLHELDVTSGEWKRTRDELVSDLLAATERHTGEAISEKELFVAPEDGTLPILEVRILHPAVLADFRRRPEVRYLEPSNYTAGELQLRSSKGCDKAPSSPLAAGDFTTYAGSKVPWNYDFMRIRQAWNRSRGEDIGICIIDSGTFPEQSRLNGNFGGGRELNRLGVFAPNWWSWRTDGPDDQCGHGTQMAGLAAAPLSGDGSTVGVAYRSDLLTIRATADVIINGSNEKRGVRDALIVAANDPGTQIVSMSIGDVFSSGTVKDGIYYAYGRGKLLLAAAGTSLSWTSWYGVIFPANLPETVAVTGVRDRSPLERCNTCHDGSQVDFVAVMQRDADTDRTSLTLSRSGSEPGYVGGSSAATATTAGIAALVWATKPGQSREQVLYRMKRAASYYPNRDGELGWGIIDAEKAVE